MLFSVEKGGGEYKKIIYLGSGTSFDVTSYEGYENFTASNFIVEPLNATGVLPWFNHAIHITAKGSGSSSLTLNKSYNASTGILSSSTTFNSSIALSDDEEYTVKKMDWYGKC